MAENLIKAIADFIAGNDPHQSYRLKLIMSELVTNAYIHGKYDSPDDQIEFQAGYDNDKFLFTIINKVASFADINQQRFGLPPVAAESGRGLEIVRKLCSKIEFTMLADLRLKIYVEFNPKTAALAMPADK